MDIYNLINSKAISEHCRKIKHQFNTEELAVLIYRNKRMNIAEKISAYEELIKDYPDMEVIKRINCKHYDSVKDMIKGEIKRIKELKEKLEKEEQDVIYTYNSWYNSTDWHNNPTGGITKGKDEYRDVYKSFNEVQELIYEEIKEDEENNLLSFAIRKRTLSKNNKYDVRAEYKVTEDKKIEMVNIYDFEGEILDISNICLNIPTPFRKGDLLVSTSKTPFSEGYVLNYDRFPFVLDWLCTWRENFQEILNAGNHDSSDMQGPGYIISENNELLWDNVFDYDNWEYFEGNLEGMERILKAISSLMQDKIDISLFISAYEQIKKESIINYIYTYTDEGLELCGFSKDGIEKINGK